MISAKVCDPQRPRAITADHERVTVLQGEIHMAHPLLAALDIGTNSVKLLLTRATTDKRVEFVAEAALVTCLGEDVAATGQLQPEAMHRTVAAIHRLMKEVKLPATGSGRGIATASSAVRDAANGREFLTLCHELIGGEPLLLSGDAEAQTVFAGATSDQPPDRYCVCMDIGGGSTEIIAGFPGHIDAYVSLNLGCVRLGEKYGLLTAAHGAQEAAARSHARQLLEPVMADIRRHRPDAAHPFCIVASGGTANTMAAVIQEVALTDREKLHGCRCDETTATDLASTLLALDVRGRQRVPWVPADRAAVLPAGLLIFSEALRLLDAPGAVATTRGLRWGLVLRLQRGELAPTWTWEAGVPPGTHGYPAPMARLTPSVTGDR